MWQTGSYWDYNYNDYMSRPANLIVAPNSLLNMTSGIPDMDVDPDSGPIGELPRNETSQLHLELGQGADRLTA